MSERERSIYVAGVFVLIAAAVIFGVATVVSAIRYANPPTYPKVVCPSKAD